MGRATVSLRMQVARLEKQVKEHIFFAGHGWKPHPDTPGYFYNGHMVASRAQLRRLLTVAPVQKVERIDSDCTDRVLPKENAERPRPADGVPSWLHDDPSQPRGELPEVIGEYVPMTFDAGEATQPQADSPDDYPAY